METTDKAKGDYVAKPLDPERCHASVVPEGTRLVFQCNMYRTHGKFCNTHQPKEKENGIKTD